jgi:hypothetical protein
MKKFKFWLLILLVPIFFTSCNSTQQKEDTKSCPQCNMKLPKSNLHTSFVNINDNVNYFDDIGCMILWAKDKGIDLTKVKTKVFTNDTKKFIDAQIANYTIGDKTPMAYGFAAYENLEKNRINFNEVILRMLRGENMANRKIRKQILGN